VTHKILQKSKKKINYHENNIIKVKKNIKKKKRERKAPDNFVFTNHRTSSQRNSQEQHHASFHPIKTRKSITRNKINLI
jgi:3-deoxy-D-arabino-heptulosonate 7-phosphate (DAHP) synthase